MEEEAAIDKANLSSFKAHYCFFLRIEEARSQYSMWTGPTCVCMQNSRSLYRLACMRVISTSYWVRILTSNNEQNIA